LEEIQIEEILPTPQIAVDNGGAQQMPHAQQPTKCICHIDMKQFVILQQMEEEQITFEDVSSALNPSNSLKSPLVLRQIP
jgi:hypothetical protein